MSRKSWGRKLRGGRRYFRRIREEDKSVHDTLDYESWFDFWHTHIDWDGIGNYRWKDRKPHVDALFRAFEYYLDHLKNRKDPYQLFLCFDVNDSGQDAVYINTPNPNRENFPFKLTRDTIIQPDHTPLSDYLGTQAGYEIVHSLHNGNRYIYLFKSEFGVALI